LKITDYLNYVKSPIAIIQNLGNVTGMKYRLYALAISQAAHIAVTSYKKSLFKTFEWVSAIALPPLIPIGWIHEDHRMISLEELPYIDRPETDLTIETAPVEYASSWYLPVQDHHYVDTMRETFSAIGISDSGLFAPFSGLFAAVSDMKNQPPALDRQLTINDLRLLHLEITYREPHSWWNHMMYSVMEERHLR
jgi:hypothetical protein